MQAAADPPTFINHSSSSSSSDDDDDSESSSSSTDVDRGFHVPLHEQFNNNDINNESDNDEYNTHPSRTHYLGTHQSSRHGKWVRRHFSQSRFPQLAAKTKQISAPAAEPSINEVGGRYNGNDEVEECNGSPRNNYNIPKRERGRSSRRREMSANNKNATSNNTYVAHEQKNDYNDKQSPNSSYDDLNTPDDELSEAISGIKSWVSNLDNNYNDEEEYPMDEGVVRSTNVVRRTKNSATIHSIIPKKSQTIPAITKMSIDRNRGNYIKTDAVVDEGLNGNNNNCIHDETFRAEEVIPKKDVTSSVQRSRKEYHTPTTIQQNPSTKTISLGDSQSESRRRRRRRWAIESALTKKDDCVDTNQEVLVVERDKVLQQTTQQAVAATKRIDVCTGESTITNVSIPEQQHTDKSINSKQDVIQSKVVKPHQTEAKANTPKNSPTSKSSNVNGTVLPNNDAQPNKIENDAMDFFRSVATNRRRRQGATSSEVNTSLKPKINNSSSNNEKHIQKVPIKSKSHLANEHDVAIQETTKSHQHEVVHNHTIQTSSSSIMANESLTISQLRVGVAADISVSGGNGIGDGISPEGKWASPESKNIVNSGSLITGRTDNQKPSILVGAPENNTKVQKSGERSKVASTINHLSKALPMLNKNDEIQAITTSFEAEGSIATGMSNNYALAMITENKDRIRRFEEAYNAIMQAHNDVNKPQDVDVEISAKWLEEGGKRWARDPNMVPAVSIDGRLYDDYQRTLTPAFVAKQRLQNAHNDVERKHSLLHHDQAAYEYWMAHGPTPRKYEPPFSGVGNTPQMKSISNPERTHTELGNFSKSSLEKNTKNILDSGSNIDLLNIQQGQQSTPLSKKNEPMQWKSKLSIGESPSHAAYQHWLSKQADILDSKKMLSDAELTETTAKSTELGLENEDSMNMPESLESELKQCKDRFNVGRMIASMDKIKHDESNNVLQQEGCIDIPSGRGVQLLESNETLRSLGTAALVKGSLAARMFEGSCSIIDTDGTEISFNEEEYAAKMRSILLSPSLITRRYQQALNVIEGRSWNQLAYLLRANPWLMEMKDVRNDQTLVHTLSLFGGGQSELDPLPKQLAASILNYDSNVSHKLDIEGNLP